MTKYLNRTRAALAVALFAGASLLTACGGLHSLLPLDSNGSTPTAPPAGSTSQPTIAPTTAPTSTPTISPQQACSVPPAQIPGTYTSLFIAGELSGSSVTLAENTPSTWSRLSYAAATPTPLPTISPTAAPSPSPGQPLYVYSGTYTVTHNGTTEPTGCAALITTQNGAPLMNQSINSLISGSPNLQGPFTATMVATGSVSTLLLTNLGPSGGSGTFSLSDGSTGTLTFTSRTSVNASALAKPHH